MRNLLPTTLLLILSCFACGQQIYEPQILILSPNNVKYDKAFEKEISDYNAFIRKNNRLAEQKMNLRTKDFQKQPANFKRMIEAEAAFSEHLDFFKQASYICEQFLTYRFFEKFPNVLIELKDVRSKGNLKELKEISKQTNLQYVLNFPSLRFYKENNISHAEINIQLYDFLTNSLLIDTSYSGDWNNPGFEFSCKDSSLSCTINNSLSQALDNVVYNIAINSPTLKKEADLSKQRLETIRNNIYNKAVAKSFVKNVILPADSTINLNNLFQTLINEDSTKFVGFFIDKVSKQNFRQLNENRNDNDVNIINDKKITDTGYLDNIPQTYAYIVKAVNYHGVWYYKKSNATYFDPQDNEGGRLQYLNNLQRWDFFTKGSATFNTDFWETNLFKKIKDLRLDPKWKEYGTTIWKTEEEENRNYIGLYEIVADQLKNKKSETRHIKMN